MTGREIKMKKEILEPEADLFPKKTGKKKGRSMERERERGQVKRPRPLLVGKGCYLVAGFKNLFSLKCIMKSWFRFSIFFLQLVQFTSSKMGI